MMWLVQLSLNRSVFAVMLIASLVGLGYISVGRLGVDLFPDVEFPYVNVTATLDGASPETMESEVTDILEEYINTIEGIEKLLSYSSEGRAQILVEFDLDSNAREKVQDVRDKVQLALAELPPDMDPPIGHPRTRSNTSLPSNSHLSCEANWMARRMSSNDTMNSSWFEITCYT